MKDELKLLKTVINGNHIVNLARRPWDPLNGPNRARKKCYCDSFGVLPPQEVISFCKRIPKSHLAYNDFAFQNIKTETCGFYSVGLLIRLHNHLNEDIYDVFSDYINMFSYDTKKNNAILKNYFRKLPQ
jgi:hypothetical protein